MNKICLTVPESYNPADFLIELIDKSRNDYTTK